MKQDSGFTLMETLVALVVLGFIVAGLAQGLRFGLVAWDRQAVVIDRDGAPDGRIAGRTTSRPCWCGSISASWGTDCTGRT